MSPITVAITSIMAATASLQESKLTERQILLGKGISNIYAILFVLIFIIFILIITVFIISMNRERDMHRLKSRATDADFEVTKHLSACLLYLKPWFISVYAFIHITTYAVYNVYVPLDCIFKNRITDAD